MPRMERERDLFRAIVIAGLAIGACSAPSDPDAGHDSGRITIDAGKDDAGMLADAGRDAGRDAGGGPDDAGNRDDAGMDGMVLIL